MHYSASFRVLAVAALTLLSLPSAALAQQGMIINPLNAGSIPELLMVILNAVIELGAMAIVLMLVWVGFLFVKAQGNESELKKAREALMYTVIGGLILLGASGIGLVLRNTIESL